MPEILVNQQKHIIDVPIPLTAVSGKIRVKNRSVLNEYGTSVATRRDGFTLNNYVEWQIGYDVVKKDIKKLVESSLTHTEFTGANQKTKALYELSEYIWYFYHWNVISKKDLESIAKYLTSIPVDNLIDNNLELQIHRNNPITKEINGFEFEYTQVKYPLLIYKFDSYEIVTEIKVTEQQRGAKIQPMLYLCFPISTLKTKDNLIGRKAYLKEVAHFYITEKNIKVFLEILKMFGILSNNHRHDILKIIETILKSD